MVLRAIATYNEQTLDIHEADVQAGEEGGETSKSRMPSPGPGNTSGERSPLPQYSLKGEDGDGSTPGSRTRYDSVGIGPPPPMRSHPLRTGSAFYSVTPAQLESPNRFDESFARATENDEEERLIDGAPTKGETKEMTRIEESELSWWESWVEQIGKLFVPQWRRTVILMWIIWGSMSFCKWVPEGTPSADRVSIHDVQRMVTGCVGEPCVRRRG